MRSATFAALLLCPLGSIIGQTRSTPFDYHDDHDGRILAEIRFEVRQHDGGYRVQMVIAAQGPRVAAIPGYRGIAGGNRFTAEQFARLLASPAGLQVRTSGNGSATPWPGSIRAGRMGKLPERRLLPNGAIDYLGRTRHAYPLELLVDLGPLTPGVCTTEVLADGVPRLRVTYQVRADTVRLLDAESLGANNAVAQSAVGDQPGQSLPPPVSEAEWEARDADGKWVYYRRSVIADEKQREAWVDYLLKRKEFDFLEAVALYDDSSVVKALARADAPNWIRLAAWYAESSNSFGHGESMFVSLLKSRSPEAVASWLDKHKHALLPDTDLTQTHAILKKRNYAAAAVDGHLPPLDARQVFRQLDAPKQVEEFGERRRAEPGKAYLHQVEFALEGLVNSGRYEQPWLEKAQRLTSHPHAQVRRAALLAYSHFLRFDPRQAERLTEFLNMIDDARQPDRVREAALLAATSVSHPRAALEMLRLARTPSHPAWSAAVSRLGESSSHFALEVLQMVASEGLPADRQTLLKDARARIQSNLTGFQPEQHLHFGLELLAWAELTQHPVHRPLAKWTTDYFTRHGGPRLDAKLRALARQFEANYPMIGREAIYTERVRALAAEISAAREKSR
jgi:hypothetical protein